MLGRANAPALEWQGQTYTFGEIEAASNQIAGWLAAQGFVAGDRLCVQLPNSLFVVQLFLACLKLGVIYIPINVLYRDREVGHILQDAAPRLFLHAGEALPSASGYPSSRPNLGVLAGSTVAALIYTSGTTGPAKGAMLTHDNFAFNAMALRSIWNLNSEDRLLLALPLFHVHGLGNGILTWLVAGYRLRLLERFEAKLTEQEFLSFRPTVFFGVPTMYVRMLDWAAVPPARLFVSGSAPLAEHTHAAFREKFGAPILERYGMTEALMIASNPLHGERRAGTVGLALPGVKVEVRPPEQEVFVQGPNVCAGYWGRPGPFLEDGWFRTGDIGALSEDGYLTLNGRKSDLIISSGFNIYPREIEEYLLEQPEIQEAAVIGVPDAAKGEVPVACLVAASGAKIDAETILGRCRESLASFKVPRRVIWLDRLPRNALGKIQKHLLAGEIGPQ
ncbi:MAG: AMP-binding protein [Bryobacter sp.]|nr:AMP-binding protein [Bryobacter sp.]